MITIYEYGPDQLFTGQTMDIGVADGAPMGWTRVAPPSLAPGQYAHFSGEWVVLDEKPVAYDPPAPPLPTLTARQLRLALVGKGISLSSVTAIIAAIPDEKARETAQIEWEYASEYRRDHALISTLGPALKLSDDDIDRLWKTALAL